MDQLKLLLLLNTLLVCYGYEYNYSPYYYRLTDDAYIQRPCEVFDRFCIRKYFKEHSSCKPMDRPVPDPLYRDQTSVHFAHANITFIPNNINITGLNGVIVEFYVNKKTDNLVLAVEFRDLNASSPTTYGRFYRRGQEPTVEMDYASSAFRSLVTTIIIPNLKDLQLGKSEVFSYSNDVVPLLVLGPRLNKPDYVVDPMIAIREILLTDTQYYIGSYIQYTICDFGLKLR